MTGITLPNMVPTEALVRRAAAGDLEACSQLVLVYNADMVRAAFVITGDGEGALDATQMAWAKAWQRSPAVPSTWSCSCGCCRIRTATLLSMVGWFAGSGMRGLIDALAI